MSQDESECDPTFREHLEALRGAACSEPARALDRALDLTGQMLDGHLTAEHIAPQGRVLGLTSLSQKARYLRFGRQAALADLVDALRATRDAVDKDPDRGPAVERVLDASGAIMDKLACGATRARLRISDSLRLVNAVSVETPVGYRSFHLLQGDVLDTPSDLLVLSTHALADRPPSGQMLQRLRLRLGIDIDPERVHLRLGTWGWTVFQSATSPAPFRGVLTLRIEMVQHEREHAAHYEEAIRGLYASIAALEWQGHELPVIAMPVLAAQRVVDYGAAAESLLRNAVAWLKKSQHTHTIALVVHQLDEIAVWDRAMNECLGRSYVATGQIAVVDSLCREIMHLARQSDEAPLSGALRPLLEAISTGDQICIENVCVFGRKLVEQMSWALIASHHLRQSQVLMNNIEELSRAGVAAPWIISYMHSLRIFGNETVHARQDAPRYRPKSLGPLDLVSALSAVRALLAFWQEHGATPVPE